MLFIWLKCVVWIVSINKYNNWNNCNFVGYLRVVECGKKSVNPFSLFTCLHVLRKSSLDKRFWCIDSQCRLDHFIIWGLNKTSWSTRPYVLVYLRCALSIGIDAVKSIINRYIRMKTTAVSWLKCINLILCLSVSH